MSRFHTLTSFSLALFAVFALTPFATGQTESILGGLDDGIWGIPGPIFHDLISRPNATGSISFSPDNSSQWTLQLNITADVPLTNATDSVVEDDRGDYATASVLSLVGDGGASSSNTTICYSIWSGLAVNISAAAKGRPSQDGAGCGNMLSEQCILDLMNEGGQFAPDCQPAPVLPQSCISQMSPDLNGVASSFEYNSSDPVFYMEAANPTSERDNQTAWSSASTNIWPVLLAFFPNRTDGSIAVELNCIRPDTFSADSTNPNEDSTNGTSTSGTSSGSPTSQPTSSPSSAATVTDRSSVAISLSLALALLSGLF